MCRNLYLTFLLDEACDFTINLAEAAEAVSPSV
ncbi:hypothetical protein R3I94_009334 [Phoxinus phoxinus]